MSGYIYIYEGRPKIQVFGFHYRHTGRNRNCRKLCARKERASAAQGMRKVTVLKGPFYCTCAFQLLLRSRVRFNFCELTRAKG